MTEPEAQAAAAWDKAPARLQSFTDASNMPRLYRGVYDQCNLILAQHARYTAQSDPHFNAAIGALFTAEEWAELNVMKAQIQALVTEWDTNHGDAVGKPKAALLPIIEEDPPV